MSINLEKITARRREIISNAIKNNIFDIDTFANYFEVKRKLIEEDLQALSYTDHKKQKNTDYLSRLQEKRDKKIIEYRQSGMSDDEILEKIGMWHFPINIKQTESLFFDMVPLANPKLSEKELMDAIADYQLTPNEQTKSELIRAAEEYIPHFNDALLMCQLGASKTDIGQKFKWTGATTTKFSKIVKQLGIAKTPDFQLLNYPEVRKSLDEICKKYNVRKITQHTGVVSGLINDIKNFGVDEVYLNSQNKAPSKKQQNIEDRRKKVWELYNQFGSTHGFKEEEIASMLGITRATVSHDLRAHKNQNPEVVDETQLYRSRHNGIEKYMTRVQKKNDVLYIYDKVSKKHPDASNYTIVKAISEVTNIRYEMVHQYLIEEGRIIPYQFRNAHLEQEVNHEAKIGWENKGQFGFGATRILLDEQNIEKGSVEERNVRQNILDNQRATMAYLRNNPEAKAEFKSDGNLERVLTRTREINDENINSNIEEVQEEDLELA